MKHMKLEDLVPGDKIKFKYDCEDEFGKLFFPTNTILTILKVCKEPKGIVNIAFEEDARCFSYLFNEKDVDSLEIIEMAEQ